MNQAIPITEKQFMDNVIELGTVLRWRHYHTHDPRRSPAGFPDIVFVRDRVIFAELKTSRGRVRLEQLQWLASLRAAGAECYLWRPGDWDEIEGVLR